MRHRLRLPVLITAVCLVLAGCGGGDKEPTAQSDEPSQEPTSEPAPEPAQWPFTGLEVTGDLPRHGVLVTKVDNTASSAPQVGLGKADLVVEELVEGGMTRLAAIFYSGMPPTVGPVRSMRASDIGIVPDGATVVTSGAADVTLNRIKAAGIAWVTEGDAGVYRETSRSSPYNLFARLAEIAKRTKPDGVPEPYLPWGTGADLPKGGKASTIEADFGNHTTSWRFEKGRYVNINSYAADGDEFPTDTVLVLRVKVGDAGYVDPTGAPVPETEFEGKGQALIFHKGRVVRGTWSKDGLKGDITLSHKQGDLTVPAGHVWVELVPAADGSVSFAK